jgi:hypothetical protein
MIQEGLYVAREAARGRLTARQVADHYADLAESNGLTGQSAASRAVQVAKLRVFQRYGAKYGLAGNAWLEAQAAQGANYEMLIDMLRQRC